MTRRTERVDELVRREIAAILIAGELRDPRLAHGAHVAITGVRVSGDLSIARVFVDVLAPERDRAPVLAALRASAPLIRSLISSRMALRRLPKLIFEYDESVARGVRMEQLLADIRSNEPVATPDVEIVAESELGGDEQDDEA